MKYLVAGLGNIGTEYANTRHNIGFDILDALAGASNISFKDKRYGFVAEHKYKARTFVLLKPSTYMNLSGNAVRYWLRKEKLSIDKLLVVVDDLALPFGTLRLRPKGGDAGHNGLNHIQNMLGTAQYARLRFGIGNDFHAGQQSNYVLSKWSPEEKQLLPGHIEKAVDIIHSFGTIGFERTKNHFKGI